MKSIVVFLFLFLISSISTAQKHDNVWLLGYNGQNPHPELGGTNIDFSELPPTIFKLEREMNFWRTCANISSKDGHLLFYTNGIYIADSTNQIMQNGNGLNPGEFTNEFISTGSPVPQGAIVLPCPDHDNLFYLFHVAGELSTPDFPTHISKFYFSKIDMNLNNGLGEVIIKNQLIIEDTLAFGKIVSTKHANGKDWWILLPEHDRNNYYKILLAKDSINVTSKQNVEPGIIFEQGSVGQAIFSPDGSKYIRHDLRLLPIGNTVDIYDFDRCTGLLSNNIHIQMPDTSGITGGVAVSPNSRFLYVIARETIYQYDFWASDFLASREIVAEYDGFVSFFPTKFNLAQLGPDGKIYINTLTTDNYLHVINHPNRKGMDCEVLQHSIKLPTLNDRSIPNFPNYRLGPIDESTCDTLGIDNLPLANYTYEKDSINTLSVSFTDNSFYEPIDWFWDFDNGKMSNEVNPIHEFEEEGFYNVCLTVSNQYDSDTFCREIELMTTSIKEIEKNEKHFELYPNPAQNIVTVRLPVELTRKGTFVMFNSIGEEVLRSEIPSETISVNIKIEHIPNGIYLCNIIEGKKEIYTQRLVITK